MDISDPTTVRKADPDVVGEDPFWSVVRRRHRDVDIVLLPPEPTPVADPGTAAEADTVAGEDPATENDIAAALARLQDVWDRLGRRTREIVHRDLGAPSVRWSHEDAGRRLLVRKALPGIGVEAGTDLLCDLAAVLADDGWALRPRGHAGHPSLVAVDGEHLVEAEVGPAATLVTARGALLAVADGLAASVRGALREAAASWR